MSGISTVVSVPYRSFVTEGKAGVRSGNSASGNRGCQNNAKLNGITNAQFFVGKAEEVLPQFYENAKKKENITDDTASTGHTDMLRPDVIVVDPPRKGCDEKCLDTMLAMSPERIVYVSCDSATLARDLKILCEEKYELIKWQAFDQFSHTTHVESICLLERVSN